MPVSYYGGATATATPSVRHSCREVNRSKSATEEQNITIPWSDNSDYLLSPCSFDPQPSWDYNCQTRGSSLVTYSQKGSHGRAGPCECAVSPLCCTPEKKTRDTRNRL